MHAPQTLTLPCSSNRFALGFFWFYRHRVLVLHPTVSRAHPPPTTAV